LKRKAELFWIENRPKKAVFKKRQKIILAEKIINIIFALAFEKYEPPKEAATKTYKAKRGLEKSSFEKH